MIVDTTAGRIANAARESASAIDSSTPNIQISGMYMPMTRNTPKAPTSPPMSTIASGGLSPEQRVGTASGDGYATNAGKIVTDAKMPRSNASRPKSSRRKRLRNSVRAEQGEAERGHADEEEVEGADLPEPLERDRQRDRQLAPVFRELRAEHGTHLVAAPAGLGDQQRRERDERAHDPHGHEHPAPALVAAGPRRDPAGEQRCDGEAGHLARAVRARTPCPGRRSGTRPSAAAGSPGGRRTGSAPRTGAPRTAAPRWRRNP